MAKAILTLLGDFGPGQQSSILMHVAFNKIIYNNDEEHPLVISTLITLAGFISSYIKYDEDGNPDVDTTFDYFDDMLKKINMKEEGYEEYVKYIDDLYKKLLSNINPVGYIEVLEGAPMFDKDVNPIYLYDDEETPDIIDPKDIIEILG